MRYTICQTPVALLCATKRRSLFVVEWPTERVLLDAARSHDVSLPAFQHAEYMTLDAARRAAASMRDATLTEFSAETVRAAIGQVQS